MANAVTDASFDDEVLKSNEPVLVDFHAYDPSAWQTLAMIRRNLRTICMSMSAYISGRISRSRSCALIW